MPVTVTTISRKTLIVPACGSGLSRLEPVRRRTGLSRARVPRSSAENPRRGSNLRRGKVRTEMSRGRRAFIIVPAIDGGAGGDDGAAGMQEMHEAGSITIAQDEKTSVVWGMPGEAVALGCVDHVVPLQSIAHKALSLVKK